MAVGLFANFLEYAAPASAFVTVLFMLIPLGVSYDAAAASSDCDLLADTLNEKRKRGDATDPDFEHAIGRVEQILDRENTKQGLDSVRMAVRAVVGSWENSSMCSYNQTLDGILAGV